MCDANGDANGNADQKCKETNSPTAFHAHSTDVRIPERAFSHELDEMKKRRVTRAVNTSRPLRPPREQQAVMLEIPVSRAYTPPVIDRAQKKKIRGDVSRMRKPPRCHSEQRINVKV